MWKLFRDLFKRGGTRTVIVFNEDGIEQPRRHQIEPAQLVRYAVVATVGPAFAVLMLLLFSPLGRVVSGSAEPDMSSEVRLTLLRLQAMQDSLETQQQYLVHLRQLVIGNIDSLSMAEGIQNPEQQPVIATDVTSSAADASPADWTDHEQPAVSYWRFASTSPSDIARRVASAERSLVSLQLPVTPPVTGFMTRGFDARRGHFGVDFAVDEGSVVRSIGEGYVVFADWTHEGGYTIAVQHADGYMSLYKHNQRLLKQIGERVSSREAIAVSGNTGETTTGPHLHVEFWHNGLAQDPRYYFVSE